jgi:DNA-binding LacI/PurR family transcriptional regulator
MAQIVVRDKLLRRLGKEWRVGDRLPPIKQLARVLSAGQSNTHLAVRQLASDGVLVSRPKEGTFVLRLPEAPSPEVVDLRGRVIQARHLSETPEGTAGDRFVIDMIDGFRDELANTGAQIHIQKHESASDDPFDAIATFNMGHFVRALPAGPQLVVVSTSLAQLSSLPADADAVGVNDHQGAMLAGQAMARLGVKEACFVGRPLDWPRSDQSRLDLLSALRLYGFEAGFGRTVSCQHIIGVPGYSLPSGGKAFRRYLRLPRRPKAVFTASDDLAIGFATAALSEGLRPGEDFHLIGFDGQERGRVLVDGGLTTVEVPAREMGRRAAQLLRARMLKPHQPVVRLQLECALRSGATTGAHL